MKRVLFITKVCFLDAALEYIDQVKNHVALDVLIEIDPNTLRQNILDVAAFPERGAFAEPAALLGKDDYAKLTPYMQGCRSFRFLIHRNPKSTSPWGGLRGSFAAYRYIRRIRPDVLHFDDVSLRLLLLLLFLGKRRKIVVNAHDPTRHSGEHDWRYTLPKKQYYRKAIRVLTFSRYSQLLFRQQYGHHPDCLHIPLQPYRVYQAESEKAERKYITFVGRLSLYKGIDLFTAAMRIINTQHPQQQFIIAGKPAPGFDMQLPDDRQLRLCTRHLTTVELSHIIRQSLAVVCPYRDATQSGVIMTAYALGTPVIVTNVGGLPEYVEEGVTGYITESNAPALAAAFGRFVTDAALADKLGRNILNTPVSTMGKEQIIAIYS